MSPGSSGADLEGPVAEPAVVHHGRQTTTSNLASNCRYNPGSEDESAGPIALASTGSQAVAADIVAHFGETTSQIPTTGAEDWGSPALAANDLPMAGVIVVSLTWWLAALPPTAGGGAIGLVAGLMFYVVLKPNRATSG